MTERLYDRRAMLKVMTRAGACVAAVMIVGCGGENPLEEQKKLAQKAESTDVPP